MTWKGTSLPWPYPNNKSHTFCGDKNSGTLGRERLSVWHQHGRITLFPFSTLNMEWAGIAQSVQRLATGWTVQGSDPGGGKNFRTCPDRPWGSPNLLYNGSFPGVKRPERDVDHPLSSAEVKGRIELYLYSTSGPCGLLRCELYLYLYPEYGNNMMFRKAGAYLTFWHRSFSFKF
jgi:hypothetical protein